jgi:hypothetical protein
MSGRSSRHKLLWLCILAACGNKSAKVPEADPAQAAALATKMNANMPAPSATRLCTDADFFDAVPITYRSIRILAGQPVPEASDFRSQPSLAEWTNSPMLEAPALRPLIDGKAAEPAKRRAAAAFLNAKGLAVYIADVVNAPIALQVKHLATGTIHARVIRFEAGQPVCVQQIEFQNDKVKSDWAIARSDKPLIDPEVAKAMRDDLVDQYVKHAPTTTRAPAPK